MKEKILILLLSINTLNCNTTKECFFEPVFVTPQRESVPLVWENMVEGIKSYEGFKPNRYRCPAGVLTVGYGHTARASSYRRVTKTKAKELLKEDLAIALAHVENIVTVELTEGQKAALVSFTFNCGPSNLKKLVEGPSRLNSGNYASVERLLPRYRMGGGRVLRGLETRRAWELDLWRSECEIRLVKN